MLASPKKIVWLDPTLMHTKLYSGLGELQYKSNYVMSDRNYNISQYSSPHTTIAISEYSWVLFGEENQLILSFLSQISLHKNIFTKVPLIHCTALCTLLRGPTKLFYRAGKLCSYIGYNTNLIVLLDYNLKTHISITILDIGKYIVYY